MCSPNSFHLPDLSSDFKVRQLPKLAPLSLRFATGCLLKNCLSLACLHCAQFFLAITSLAPDLQDPGEGASFDRKHQL